MSRPFNSPMDHSRKREIPGFLPIEGTFVTQFVQYNIPHPLSMSAVNSINIPRSHLAENILITTLIHRILHA